MRCLALAQAWQDPGGRAVFAMAENTEAVRKRLGRESCDVLPVSSSAGVKEDLRHTIALARENNCEWVVVDGYEFRADYQQGLRAANLRVLLLDDCGHSERYVADVVLNQNASATSTLYSNREPQSDLLLGPRYAMLRREFSAWRDWKREIQPVCSRLLVLMGGSDEGNVTAAVIESLRLLALRELETTVVIGALNPHFAELRDQAEQSGLSIKLLTDVSNVGELMAGADLAISAAGSTCLELCLLGLPTLLIDVADNQAAVATELHQRGCAIHIGDAKVTAETIADKIRLLILTQELRRSLSYRSRELVDGKGATRVVSILRGQEALHLRPVQLGDRRLLWEWANDPEVRASSFSPDPISWETHEAWFDEKLHSSQKSGSRTLIFIAQDKATNALGQIRFDSRPDGDWEVGISLDRNMRGRGLGSELIAAGLRKLLQETRTARVHAHVKLANVASARSFERVAFRRAGVDQIRGIPAIHLIYQ
jgi:UDP-2,4-diacetamido-2,4,6-trideoxy-beta-L-altropyranose hydrolase